MLVVFLNLNRKMIFFNDYTIFSWLVLLHLFNIALTASYFLLFFKRLSFNVLLLMFFIYYSYFIFNTQSFVMFLFSIFKQIICKIEVASCICILRTFVPESFNKNQYFDFKFPPIVSIYLLGRQIVRIRKQAGSLVFFS